LSEERIAKLEADLRIAVEALEFYANKENWVQRVMLSQNPEANLVDYLIEEFGGSFAREALEKLK
jgi:hypothetical protein